MVLNRAKCSYCGTTFIVYEQSPSIYCSYKCRRQASTPRPPQRTRPLRDRSIRKVRRALKHIPEYAIYAEAKQRCRNTKHPRWLAYGGRGIEFQFTSFEEFLDALKTPENPSGLRPEGKDIHGRATFVLDRIDNDWHYGVRSDGTSNIRWTTWSVSNSNQRRWLKTPRRARGLSSTTRSARLSRSRVVGVQRENWANSP